MKNSINFKRLSFVLFIVFVATVQIGGCQKTPAPPVPLPTPSPAPGNPACNCVQYDLICNNGTGTCVALECVYTSFNDGLCSAYGGPPIDQPLMADASKLFGISFSAYQDAIRSGSGSPDAKMWEAISKMAPNPDVAKAVTYMTNDIIFISLSQDVVVLTPQGLSGACEITSVSDKKATLGLIEALKAGTILALKNNDPTAVKAPISEFFKKNPEFKPTKPGVCYSAVDARDTASCISTALENRLGQLIGK